MPFPTRRSLAAIIGTLILFVLMGGVFYWNSITQLKELELERVRSEVVRRSEAFTALAELAQSQVRSIAESMAVGAIVEIEDPMERARLASDFASLLRAYPVVQQVRLLGTDENGREWLRVERDAYGTPPRVVPVSELQSKRQRDYFVQGLRLKDREVHVTPIGLNYEHGVVERPLRPVMRAVTPVFRVNGTRAALVVVNLDLNREFARLQRDTSVGLELFVVDADGQFLSHPDESRRFGVAQDTGFTARDEFPQWDSWKDREEGMSEILHGPGIGAIGVVELPVVFQGDPEPVTLAYLVARAPDTLLRGMAGSIARMSAGAAAALAIGLVLLLIVLWRSLIRPLDRIIAAVSSYDGTSTMKIPLMGRSEFQPLAQSIEPMRPP